MSKTRVAVPSMLPGGLNAGRSGHFGRCDVFTIVDIEDGKIVDTQNLLNVEHSEGGCLVPVNLLADNKVQSLVVGGMGLRPLMGFKEAGIQVYIGQGVTVEDSISAYLEGTLEVMSEEGVCRG